MMKVAAQNLGISTQTLRRRIAESPSLQQLMKQLLQPPSQAADEDDADDEERALLAAGGNGRAMISIARHFAGRTKPAKLRQPRRLNDREAEILLEEWRSGQR